MPTATISYRAFFDGQVFAVGGSRLLGMLFESLRPSGMRARVAARVAQGGHNVPKEVVRRRFCTGLRNFEEVYKDLVGAWNLYDNSGTAHRYCWTREKSDETKENYTERVESRGGRQGVEASRQHLRI
jgi:hypothetical protein